MAVNWFVPEELSVEARGVLATGSTLLAPDRVWVGLGGTPCGRSIVAGRSMVYAPGIWRWIMTVIRAFPRALMRRLKF